MEEDYRYCARQYAAWHGDERFVDISCTCGQCHDQEAAHNWLDWLAEQHNSQEEQRNWYALVALYGYDLPASVWRYVVEQMSSWRQHEAEMAERAAGWDPNP